MSSDIPASIRPADAVQNERQDPAFDLSELEDGRRPAEIARQKRLKLQARQARRRKAEAAKQKGPRDGS
ncbi:hypothetical protein [uncultured Tateyamaria sp.]|uniref:hypothetical protein n=1 Tax=uncultured Tateyamaria sp. TaxID=455651 RepID=UPI00262D841B|nr:hypothetical protein [uncultured Tateyamaria sp.]